MTFRMTWPGCAVCVLGMIGCRNDCVHLHTEPLAPITDLAATVIAHDSVDLHWTASGDDGLEGRAAEYDVRYALSQITDANWEQAVRCQGELPPGRAGEEEVLSVSGLTDFTRYHFAMRVADEVPNWSGLSNVAGCRTAMLDDIPPVIDSLSLPNFHVPVPCWYICIHAHDEAPYPEAVTPVESLQYWYRLTGPPDITPIQSDPMWSTSNRDCPLDHIAGSPGDYTIEGRARDNSLNLSDVVIRDFGSELQN